MDHMEDKELKKLEDAVWRARLRVDMASTDGEYEAYRAMEAEARLRLELYRKAVKS